MQGGSGLKACDRSLNWPKKTPCNLLVHYDPSLPIKLAAKASAYDVGTVTSHIMPDKSE